LEVALVSPNGRSLLVMAGLGNSPVSNLELSFSDQAAAQVTSPTPLTSGSYKPSNLQGSPAPTFPAPGPGTSYGNPGPALAGTATFGSVFDGESVNGTWSLYVNTFGATNSGALSGGWDLTLSTTPPATTRKKCKKAKKKRSAATAKKKCKKKKKKK
jgi:subtilisin-like proprotein convertase family protein